MAGVAFGIGIGRLPLQYFHRFFVSKANLTLRRQREYSGPVASSVRIRTPRRLGESGLYGRKAKQSEHSAPQPHPKPTFSNLGPLASCLSTNPGTYVHACGLSGMMVGSTRS
ncbi:hypothetical protein GGP41_003092 [Bipolaris sorokiniana]|uniref:Uncharacterized protein n=1 Tax=Cochliobolus sativus TaxID=45130 RepID=A0A8H5ZA40_COCSA|nr:hypothetical protein GGP41_003092 [Bipolaris sorokiniana]